METDEASPAPTSSLRKLQLGSPPPLQDNTLDQRASLGHRGTVRARPSQILQKQYAEPPAPLKAATPPPTPSLASKSSKMSLFHLFSRPKVERSRGYAEQGLTVPTPAATATAAAKDDKNISNEEALSERIPRPPARAPSSLSLRGSVAKVPSKSNLKAAPQSTPRKAGPWEPPPLFQAYPQSTKHDALEMSAMTHEALVKSRRAGALQVLATADATATRNTEGKGNAELRRSHKSGASHGASGMTGHLGLSRKIIVLVNSGYLLQYAEMGAGDRLPEKVLQLGPGSAAFACDLIPGQHYVLQVSQTVNQQGMVMAESGSLLSRLGFRSTAARRAASNFLLVMPNAQEMDTWMVAIRNEIEQLGGKKVRSGAPIRPETGNMSELKKTPSQSHRYQVKRNPNKVVSPSDMEISDPMPSSIPKRGAEAEDDEKAETATLDGIEQEAAQLDIIHHSPESPFKFRQGSEGNSNSSSAATSVEHPRPNSPRPSPAPTLASTAPTSYTTSLSDSPPSEQSQKGSSEAPRDIGLVQAPHRARSPHLDRRRSLAAMSDTRGGPPAKDVSAPTQRHSIIAGSSTARLNLDLARSQTRPLPPTGPIAGGNVPNFRSLARVKAKHDSIMHSATPPVINEDARPVSVVGDLPPPLSSSSNCSSPKRISLIQVAAPSSGPAGNSPPSASANGYSSPDAANNYSAPSQRHTPRQAVLSYSEPFRSRRQSTQTFTLPLKINVSTPANRPPPRSASRNSLRAELEEAATTGPTVHTLTAKVDLSQRRFSAQSPVSTEQMAGSKYNSPGNGSSRDRARPSSNRFSGSHSTYVFSPPGTVPIGLATTGDCTDDASSSLALRDSPPGPGQQTNIQPLRRPISLQVRADYAPFVQSIRDSSTGRPLSGTRNVTTSTTVPIRSLKPSRMSTRLSNPVPHFSIPDPFAMTSPTLPSFLPSPSLAEEATDEPSPLPADMAARRSASPVPGRSLSRTGGGSRRSKIRTSLPGMDFGIPIVGLGPPAPPPSVPLPLPPSESRTSSPTPENRPTDPVPGLDGLTGLGISV